MDEINSVNPTLGGASSDTPQILLQVSQSPNQQNQPQGWQQPRPQRKRISGAQQKRRRKARLAAEAASNGQDSQVAEMACDSFKVSTFTPRQVPITNSGNSNKRVRSDDTLPSTPWTAQVTEAAHCPCKLSTCTQSQAFVTNSDYNNKKAGYDNTSPSPPPMKKRCVEPFAEKEPNNYKGVVNRHLRVAVVDKNNSSGKLTKAQAEAVQKALEKALDNYLFSLPEELSPPTFKKWMYSGEVLRILCEDDQSLNWLIEAVGNLSPLWEAACLEVVQVDQLPGLQKAVLWIPGIPEDIEVVQRRLKLQNPWTDTSKWCIFHTATRDSPQGRLVIFGIGEDAAKAINNKGGKLNYKFTSINIKIQKSAAHLMGSRETKQQQKQQPQQLPLQQPQHQLQQHRQQHHQPQQRQPQKHQQCQSQHHQPQQYQSQQHQLQHCELQQHQPQKHQKQQPQHHQMQLHEPQQRQSQQHQPQKDQQHQPQQNQLQYCPSQHQLQHHQPQQYQSQHQQPQQQPQHHQLQHCQSQQHQQHQPQQHQHQRQQYQPHNHQPQQYQPNNHQLQQQQLQHQPKQHQQQNHLVQQHQLQQNELEHQPQQHEQTDESESTMSRFSNMPEERATSTDR